jgi:hypothetical protein
MVDVNTRPEVYLNKLLMKSTERALEELGKSSKEAIIYFMQKEGVWTSAESFNITNFDIVAHRLLHTGADVIMDRIYQQFRSAIKISKIIDDRITIDDDSNLSPLQKIKRIFEVTETSVRGTKNNYYG